MSEFFPTAVISRAGPIRELREQPDDRIGAFEIQSSLDDMVLDDYVAHGPVDALLVVHHGTVVYEAYPRMLPTSRHLTWSVSKTFASTLIGLLEERGLVDVEAPIEAYVRELKGTGWRGVTVKDVLDMTSGIDCLEFIPGALDDPSTCYYHYHASLGWADATEATPASPYEHLAAMRSARPAGEALEYTSVDSFLRTFRRWRVQISVFFRAPMLGIFTSVVSYELHDDDGSLLQAVEHATLDYGWWRSFQRLEPRFG
jgi:CubicO group peptidase (beta-lactamase class C family)